jgi:hypothetical protein
VYIVKVSISNTMLHVRYVHLTKAEHIHKRQTHPLVRGDYDCTGSVARKKMSDSGREPQAVWRQDELIGGKPPVESEPDS